ncbi:High-affinity zinc uptake system protein ZnuA precursor [Roseovarius gaetbuli]|uniref:High-affinity zinc uptake system protein ZnuA n=1 Tax=Roseovarius gaetbuli TaxID=1356575 RepID=A0A1X6YRF1_9RHOB|nr:zinc ABC transporter substrate-binding protein [Roseovarius gaetbuli]SLN28292.1 High-affinity zinc uptake system protein ZnuA precursor [Roseovarius gaetbuli]
MLNRLVVALAGAVSGAVGLASVALAEAPRVAVDVAPVQSLVARVMQGVGTPTLIVRPGASPHGYAMRPSEAAALEEADLVIWVGEALTPWLEGGIETLASRARVVELLGAEETRVLDLREGVVFGAAQDGETPAAHDHDHDHHDHEGFDPHAWLDPENARRWLGLFADELAALDPEHAAQYAENAATAQAELDALMGAIKAELAPIKDARFLVYHDAYQYFEAWSGLHASGAIALGDAANPGPARVAALRDMARAQDIACVFSEPQFDPKLVTRVFGDVAGHGVLDPMASDHAPGPTLYPDLMRAMARALATCLGSQR